MAAQSRSKLFPCFLILLQSLLYGFGDPISKFAFDVMPVYSLLVLRYSMALVVLLLLLQVFIHMQLVVIPEILFVNLLHIVALLDINQHME